VAYLSVSESHRRVGRRPGRVGTRSRRGCRVAPARRRPISRRVAAPLMGVRPAPPEGSSAPSSVGAVNRTVSPRISRGVRLDPTKVGAHLPRLAVPTERYGRGCPEVSVLIRRRFVRSSPRLALPTERYRRGSSEVSVSIRRRFVRTLLGCRWEPNGIAEDVPRCRSWSDEGSYAPSSVGAGDRTVSPRMFRGVRLDPAKVRGDLCRDPARHRRGGGRTFGGSDATPLDIGVLTGEVGCRSRRVATRSRRGSRATLASRRRLSRRVASLLGRGWRAPPRVAPHPPSVSVANRTVSPRMFRGVRRGTTKVRGDLC
jgi:hypothetical protein